jgi:glycosyltransferase involved in cell wall biosynthesis
MKPKISVITPSYNQGQFLEETILSVIHQNYQNLEYIIIDGGSTDNSLEIIKTHEKDLYFWVSEKDNGQSAAINKGFRIATGEIICWINSDDILMPYALENAADFFDKNPGCYIFNGYTLRIDKNSKVLFNHFVPKIHKWFAKHGVYYTNQPSMFFRRDLLRKIGLLNENFHARMDKEFVIRALDNGFKIGFLAKILASVRIHENTKTAQNGLIWESDDKMIENIYGYKFKTKRDFIGLLIYRFYKLIRLDYFHQFLFSIKWKGKSVKNYFQ